MTDALNDLMKLKYPDNEWKTFTHAPIPDNMIPEVFTETINKKRFYVTPDGNKYPSITTVPREAAALIILFAASSPTLSRHF